jgi:eukaryotic-like serine/threonine-protein kinase
MEVMSHIAKDPHPDILAQRPDLPPAIGEIVDRALEKEVEHRFSNGQEMAMALRACLSASK